MYHATTTDLPYREPISHTIAGCVAGISVSLLLLVFLVIEVQASRWGARPGSNGWDAVVFGSVVFATMLGGTVKALVTARVRIDGPRYHGRIESKLGSGVPLEVVWGRLHAVPFVVRLDDGRAALVEPVALALETDERDQEIDVGARIEIIGAPRWSADAPVSVYRESTVMCFAGKPEAPIGIRLT